MNEKFSNDKETPTTRILQPFGLCLTPNHFASVIIHLHKTALLY